MRHAFAFLLSLLLGLNAGAQEARKTYFVDGFHGGVYGHYPLDDYTQYMMDQLDAHPDWCIGLEIEPETWDSVRLRTPEAYERWKQTVVSDRVEYTNPAYAQPYCYNISGESIIRQFQYGMRKLRSHFPTMTFTTYSSEEPCFTSCLPQILHQLGFRHAVLKCPDTCWGGYTEAFGGELVNWIGPDGTTLLSVPRPACEELEENSVWQTTSWQNSRKYLQACFEAGIEHPVGMCYQDAGWKKGPWLGGRSRSQYVLWTDYVERIANPALATDYRMPQEDVRVALVWGSQVMQRIGQPVRRAANLIVQTENLAAMMNIVNGFRPNQAKLDEAWRQLMLAQHHDSWIVPYNRLNKQGTWADNIAIWTANCCQLADEVKDEAVPKAQAARTTYTLFNTTGKSRVEDISLPLEGGKSIDFVEAIPPFGFVTIDPNKLKPAALRKHFVQTEDSVVLENERYHIVFDLERGGCITRLESPLLLPLWGSVQAANSFASEALPQRGSGEGAGRAGCFFGELRGFFPQYGGERSSVESRATAEVVKDNELIQCLIIRGEIAGAPFAQTYTFKRGTPLIDVELQIDWKENVRIGDHRERSKDDKTAPFYNTKKMLNLLFPTTLNSPRLWKNAPFDVCESRLDSTFFDRWTDIRHNIIHSWVDISEGTGGRGLALLTDHTTSYSFGKDYPLALTVQYSGGGLWGRDHTITSPTRLHYALLPHQGLWDEAGISDICEQWNNPVIITSSSAEVTPKERWLLSLDSTGYQLSSMQVLDDGSLLMRLFNADGNEEPTPIALHFKTKSVELVDLQGNHIEDCPISYEAGQSLLTVQMPRFGIRTYILH